MSRKAGIIAPSPPPPCTLFELVRMVRVMDIQEINLDAKKAIEHFINRGIYDFVEVANIGGNCDYSTVKPRIEYLDNVYGFLLNFYCENRINDISADYYSLNEQYNELIQKASDAVMAEYTPPDSFDNTDIKVYIYSLIFKRLAYFAMNYKHYFIALDLMHRSIQYETSYRTYNGLTIPTIKKRTKKEVNSERGEKSANTRYGDRVEQQKKFYYDLYVQRCKELKKSLPATKVAMWINNYHNEYDVEYEQILFHLRNAKKENKKTSV